MTPLWGTPTGYEPIRRTDGDMFLIPKYTRTFDKWTGDPLVDSYGGKTFIDLDGECLFAELAIVRLL
jgi:hypothetical protein